MNEIIEKLVKTKGTTCLHAEVFFRGEGGWWRMARWIHTQTHVCTHTHARAHIPTHPHTQASTNIYMHMHTQVYQIKTTTQNLAHL